MDHHSRNPAAVTTSLYDRLTWVFVTIIVAPYFFGQALLVAALAYASFSKTAQGLLGLSLTASAEFAFIRRNRTQTSLEPWYLLAYMAILIAWGLRSESAACCRFCRST